MLADYLSTLGKQRIQGSTHIAFINELCNVFDDKGNERASYINCVLVLQVCNLTRD